MGELKEKAPLMTEYPGNTPSKEDYDEEPVYFCRRCFSLRIKNVTGSDFCDECGSTDIGVANIQRWKKLYLNRFGKEYVNGEGNKHK